MLVISIFKALVSMNVTLILNKVIAPSQRLAHTVYKTEATAKTVAHTQISQFVVKFNFNFNTNYIVFNLQ